MLNMQFCKICYKYAKKICQKYTKNIFKKMQNMHNSKQYAKNVISREYDIC